MFVIEIFITALLLYVAIGCLYIGIVAWANLRDLETSFK